ncbi:MAG: HD domain-containing protein, partial [Candidatus Hydrothermarchaeaceae archaeon]
MTEQKLIKNLGGHEPVEGFYVVEYKHDIREYQKGHRFMFGVSDSSAEVMVNYWGGQDRNAVEEIFNSFSKGDVVHINSKSVIYNEKLQININPPEHSLRKAERGEFDPAMFIAVTSRNIKEMEKRFFGLVESVTDPLMKGLLNDLFKNTEVWADFKRVPAAKKFHHAFIGGLLEHTLSVALFAETACKLHPSLDRDLLITGALLHDIGKIKEIDVTSTIEYTQTGMLEGHVVLGYEMVKSRLKDFPETLAMKILHIILSHHGEKSNGSPQEPMFPEAAAVHLADVYDSTIVQFITEKDDSDTDDFKIYSRMLDRRIFVK